MKNTRDWLRFAALMGIAGSLGLTGCGENRTRTSASTAPTSSQSRVNNTVQRPSDAMIVVKKENALHSSELQKGEVIRSGQVESYNRPSPQNQPVPPANPNYAPPAAPYGTGTTRGIDYDFRGNEIKGEPTVRYEEIANQDVFANQEEIITALIKAETENMSGSVLLATTVNSDCNGITGCELPTMAEVNEAKEQSGAVRNLLKRIPILRAERNKAMEDDKPSEAIAADFAEQQMMGGAAGNYNQVKLNERVPTKADKKLWPGGVPLRADIDPSVMN